MRSSLSPLAILAFLLAPLALLAQFGPQQQFFCQSPRSLDLADVDGNGTLDLIIASRQGLSIQLNTNGDGVFGAANYIGTEDVVACAGDVNNDGLPDVIGSRDDAGGIELFLNNGGTFSDPQPIVANTSANEMRLVDLDGDGDLDLFYASTNDELIVVMNADGFGYFADPVVVGSLTQLAFIQAADIDGDGDKDLVFSSHVVDQVAVCFNEQGTFGAQQPLTTDGHGVGRDIDGDGRTDVLVANAASGLVGWQRNVDQTGDLEPPTLMDQTFSAPEYITASDLDGDGDLDGIVTSSTLQEVAWFENVDGHGDFGPHQTVAFQIPATAIVTGDVDNDGDADLFVASSDLNKVVQYTNLTNATGKIMGRVFNDINGDGIFNGEDHGLANMRVESTDLGATYTNASGIYWFNAVPAGYTVSKPAESNWNFTTPSSYSVEVPAQGASQHNDFGLRAGTTANTLTPDLGSAPIRCGLSISYWATVANTGNQVSDVQLTLDLDQLSGFEMADPAPTSVNSNTVTWIFPQVQPTCQRQVHLVVHLPNSDHVGHIMEDALHATALVNGQPVATYDKPYNPVLVCAVDPNNKEVTPVGEGSQHFTPMGARLTYVIHFQNTGNAAAQNVLLLDTLDAGLDRASLRMLGSSHVCHTLLQPDGVLSFSFEGIDLPDSASDPLGSQGYVRFSIDPVDGLVDGSQVHNKAAIYFDNNAPVITNNTLNTYSNGELTGVEETVPAMDLNVYPNPAQGTATVRLGDDFKGRVDVMLFDASGSLVRQVSRRSNTVLIERNGLPAGIYLLRAVDEAGLERTTRLAFDR